MTDGAHAPPFSPPDGRAPLPAGVLVGHHRQQQELRQQQQQQQAQSAPMDPYGSFRQPSPHAPEHGEPQVGTLPGGADPWALRQSQASSPGLGTPVRIDVAAPHPQAPQELPPGGFGRAGATAPAGQPWRSAPDIIARRNTVFTRISSLLLDARKHQVTEDWKRKLPYMVKRLEEALFREARSMEEFMDESTLKARLHGIAVRLNQIKERSQRTGQAAIPRSTAGGGAGPRTVPGLVPGGAAGAGGGAPLRPPAGASKGAAPGGLAPRNDVVGVPPVVATQQGFVGNGQVQGQDVKPQVAGSGLHPAPGLAAASSGYPPQVAAAGQAAAAAPAWQQQEVQSQMSLSQCFDSQNRVIPAPNNEHRQAMLRQQQQRLLLLRHASRCPHAAGTCPVTKFCASIKTLWAHISSCRDKRCTFAHCLSARTVLGHFHQCRDQSCGICAPVRRAIRLSEQKVRRLQEQQQPVPQHGFENPTAAGAPQGPPGASTGDGFSLMHNPLGGVTLAQRRVLPPGGEQKPNKRLKVAPAQDGSGRVAALPQAGLRGGAAARTGAGGIPQPHAGPEVRRPLLDATTIPEDSAPLVDLLTSEQLEAHLRSLDSSPELFKKRVKILCGGVLKTIWDEHYGFIFHKRVDPVKMDLPDYLDIIRHPMDLGTMKKKLEAGAYATPDSFQADMELMLNNAKLYNGEGSEIFTVAEGLEAILRKSMAQVRERMAAEVEKRRAQDSVCPLCLQERLLFEPVTYYCHGSSCSGRLRRNATYYGCQDTRWCMQCYGLLSDTDPIDIGGACISKRDLVKKKNDEMNEEPWVHCDGCNRWVHQICAMFNSRRNSSQGSAYLCPRCVLARMRLKKKTSGPEPVPPSDVPGAPSAEQHKPLSTGGAAYASAGAAARSTPGNGATITSSSSSSGSNGEEVKPSATATPESKKSNLWLGPESLQRSKLGDYLEAAVNRRLEELVSQGEHRIQRSTSASLPAGSSSSSSSSLKPCAKDESPEAPSPEPSAMEAEEIGREAAPAPGVKSEDHTVVALDHAGSASEPHRSGEPSSNDLQDSEPLVSRDSHAPERLAATVEAVTDPESAKLSGGVETVVDGSLEPATPGSFGPAPALNGDAGGTAVASTSALKKACDEPATSAPPDRETPLTDDNPPTTRNATLIASNMHCLPEDGVAKVTVRVVSDCEKKHVVGERLLKRYRPFNPGYPEEFPCRSKCILVTQKIHGVDVIIFVMFVYEYGADCPPPNTNRVYISYLDSVNFFQPKSLRTRAYHEIITAYLGYMRQRGFETAHIWACPPLKGDDYIIFCHPPDQKIPREDRLCRWYKGMLDRAKELGIVSRVTDIYEEYFGRHDVNPTMIPYFEGDYWVGEIENAIDTVEKEHGPLRPPPARRAQGRLTRSSDPLPPEGDPVMTHLAKIFRPMKESFFVAYLAPPAPGPREASPDRMPVEDASATAGEAAAPGEGAAATAAPAAEAGEAGRGSAPAEDPDEVVENELCETRQSLLNHCQANHYQFDSLRRAKHSTAMLCYACHNPGGGSEDVGSQADHAQMSRMAARQKSIQLHMQLLEHTSQCMSPQCPSSKCRRLKQLLEHVRKCPSRQQRRICMDCRRVSALLHIHARKCRRDKCPVPYCGHIRGRLRQMQRQQSQLDMRRRQSMKAAFSQQQG